jgi:4-amino-4-deoxy-L-arabinose transferase-like glycosyltransferase
MLAIGNAPFPILHDMVEAYVWGQEFQLGYNQHPPFWAWICGAWFTLSPRENWSFALLDAINAGIGLAGAWALIGDFARGGRRISAFSLLLLTPIYTLGAYKYDANTIFISLWPWATHAFVRAKRTGRLDWSALFGLLAGLALLSKYYAVLPLVVCGLGALTTPQGRAYLRSTAPWISAAVAALLCAPHLIWLYENGAPPLRYFAQTSGRGLFHIWRDAFASAANVALWFVGVAAFVVYFGWRSRGAIPGSRVAERDPEAWLLWILGLGPLVLTFAVGLALGVKLTPEMPVGTLALIPLLLIDAIGPQDTQALASASRRAAVALVLAMAALSPLVMIARTFLGKNAASAPPYAEAADAVTRLWRARVGAPLSYVAGAGIEDFIAFYSPDRAHAFFAFDFDRNLWVTRQRLAERGLTAVCFASDAACIATAQTFMTAASQRVSLTVAHRFLGHVARPRDLVVFIVPPNRASAPP